MIGPKGVFFFFNDTATTEIYTLSLHDALPISRLRPRAPRCLPLQRTRGCRGGQSRIARYPGFYYRAIVPGRPGRLDGQPGKARRSSAASLCRVLTRVQFRSWPKAVPRLRRTRDQPMDLVRFGLAAIAAAFWSLPALGQTSPPPSEWIEALRAGGHV